MTVNFQSTAKDSNSNTFDRDHSLVWERTGPVKKGQQHFIRPFLTTSGGLTSMMTDKLLSPQAGTHTLFISHI